MTSYAPPTKRQKRIKMSDERMMRFDALLHASGLALDDFVETLMDAYEGQDGIHLPTLLERTAGRLNAMSGE